MAVGKRPQHDVRAQGSCERRPQGIVTPGNDDNPRRGSLFARLTDQFERSCARRIDAEHDDVGLEPLQRSRARETVCDHIAHADALQHVL